MIKYIGKFLVCFVVFFSLLNHGIVYVSGNQKTPKTTEANESPFQTTEFELISNEGEIGPDKEPWLKRCGKYFFTMDTVGGQLVAFSAEIYRNEREIIIGRSKIEKGFDVKIVESRIKPVAIVHHFAREIVFGYTIEMSKSEYLRSPCLFKNKGSDS